MLVSRTRSAGNAPAKSRANPQSQRVGQAVAASERARSAGRRRAPRPRPPGWASWSRASPQAGADRDRVRDELGAAVAERARVVAAAAVADQRHAPAVAVRGAPRRGARPARARGREQPVLATNPHVLRPVADPPQPRGEHQQRLVAGAEAGHQHHRPPVAARDAAAVEDRIDEQPVRARAASGSRADGRPTSVRRQRRSSPAPDASSVGEDIGPGAFPCAL